MARNKSNIHVRTVLLYQITLELKVNTPNEITSQKYEKIKVHISETGVSGKQRQISSGV